MKKVLWIAMTFVLLVCLAACAEKAPEAPAEPETTDTIPEEEIPEDIMNRPAASEEEIPEAEVDLGGAEAVPDVPAEPTIEAQGDPAEIALEDMMNLILTDIETTDSEITKPDAESFEYYAFTAMPEGAEAVVSEAMMSAVAHSVVLVRTQDAAEAETLAAEIEKNANPAKWLCVEAEKTIVSVHDNTVLLVMSNIAAANGISANFDALYA